MRQYLLIMGLLLTATQGVYAQAEPEVFLCVDEKGRKEYKNTGSTKGCKRVDLPQITTVHAPKRVAGSASAGASAAGSASATSAAAKTPPDFPKIDSGTQKTRDNDKKKILFDELKAEENKLATLRKDFNNGEPERRGEEINYAKYQERVGQMKDDIARTEKNIEALKRELSNVK